MSKRILLFALLVGAANAQTLGLTPDWVQQYFDNNGNPLSGGRIWTCSAGASCPGTPLPTWTDASAFTQNLNPVILDVNGRPSSGGGIWLGCLTNYKFVLQDSAGVTLRTVDNISCAAYNSSGGGGTQYWQLTGTTISNTNASGTGSVAIGGGLTVINDIQTNGGFVMRSPAGITHSAKIQAAGVMAADQTWRWPAADAVGCLSSDGIGNLNFITCGGGGGGGTPGGNSSDIQFNNSGAFGGTDNFQWQSVNQRVMITGIASTPAITVVNGLIQSDGGLNAVINGSTGTAQPYDIIRAPTGGMHALSFTADKYVESGFSNGAPSATTGDSGFPHQGALYCDTGSSPCQEKLYNGSAWVTLSAGGATSPGGSNTNIQFNGSGLFAGDSNLAWSVSLQRLTVTAGGSTSPGIYVVNGFAQSDAGFVALPGTATQFNSIRATAGGMAANSFTATSYVQSGHNPGPFSSAPPTPTNSDVFAAGALSFDVAGGIEQVFNGTVWVPLAGGGSGSPGGPTTSIQYNGAGTLSGSANFEWQNTNQRVVIQGITNTPSLVALSSYIQSDIGFVAVNNGAPATALNYNAVQAPTGGMAALSFTASKYVETGNSMGPPTATTGDTGFPHIGTIYYDTGTAPTERVWDGAAWGALAQNNIDNFFNVTQDFTGTPTAIKINTGNVIFVNNSTQIGDATNQAANIFSNVFETVNGSNFGVFNETNLYYNVGSVNTVVLSSSTGTLLLNSLSGTGTRSLCADSTGLLTVAGCSGGGGTTNLGINVSCGNLNPLTTSFQFIPSCSTSLTATGTWMVFGSVQLTVDNLSQAASFELVVNGLVAPNQGSIAAATSTTITIGGSVSQVWEITANTGDTIGLKASKVVNAGNACACGNPTLSAIYLHP